MSIKYAILKEVNCIYFFLIYNFPHEHKMRHGYIGETQTYRNGILHYSLLDNFYFKQCDLQSRKVKQSLCEACLMPLMSGCLI